MGISNLGEQNVETVSYTHLDVYKRQVMQMAYLEEAAQKFVNIATENKTENE